MKYLIAQGIKSRKVLKLNGRLTNLNLKKPRTMKTGEGVKKNYDSLSGGLITTKPNFKAPKPLRFKIRK